MSEKLDEYSEVMSRLVSETIACTPKEWEKGTLTIESDGTYINYRLKNEEQSSKAVISEKLRDLIDELYVRMDRQGEAWTQATISFYLDGNSPKFKVSFVYPQPRHISDSPVKKT